MTLKTSLFNKGIYKSTIRRYLWGSVLYSVILFVITALPIFLMIDPKDVSNYIGYSYPILYDITLPTVLIALAVPTVVGLLVFRFMHSKKQVFLSTVCLFPETEYIFLPFLRHLLSWRHQLF